MSLSVSQDFLKKICAIVKDMQKLLAVLRALFVILIGFVVFFEAALILPFSRIILLVLLFGDGVFNLLVAIFKKERDSLIRSIFVLGVLLILLTFKNLYTLIITYFGGMVALLEAVIFFVDYYLKRKEKKGSLFSILLKAVFTSFIALFLLLFPLLSSSIIFILAGIYLMMLGVVDLLKIFSIHHFYLSLPVVFSALLPVRTFMRIDEEKELLAKYSSDEYNSKAPLDVNIYLQRRGFESFGHVDVSIDNITYSYGLHDPKARHIFGSAGEGVLIKVKRDLFIKNSLKTHKTLIVSFGLYPSEDEMLKIKKRLDDLLKDAIPFDCAYKLDPSIKELDYVSDVYRDTGCELLKFKRGPFKTYFVFTTNCVKIADYLIRNEDLNLIGLRGIITPGDYLNFLYNSYLEGNGIVKDLRFYQKLDKL